MNSTGQGGEDRPRAGGLHVRLGLDIDPLWFLSCLLAAGFFSAAAMLPLWGMKLVAPQYPAGLKVTAYGTRMIGDLTEVNSLNHYIGAMVIRPESISELVLFPYALGAIIGALLFASVVRCPPALRLILSLGVWSFPVGLLVDLQWWLYQFGHQLDEEAPMRALVPRGFMPWVLGHTHIVNFDTTTGVQIGFWMMVAGAAVPGLPWLFRFLRDSWKNTGQRPGGAAVVAFLLVALLLVLRPAAASAAAATPIGDMIAQAVPGDTVRVPAGTYREHIVVSKPLTLVGTDLPVIDAGGTGDVVTIAAEGVTLRGFVIQGSGRDVVDEPAGIRVTANRSTIEGNRLRDVLYGIAIADSNGHTVRDNSITSIPEFSSERRGHALYFWHSDGNVVEGNTVDTVKDGIFFGFSAGNRIERNAVSRTRYGIHYMYSDNNEFVDNTFTNNVAGAAIMFSRHITLRGNEFAHNRSSASGYGLLLKDVDDVLMVDNLLHHNRLGITMEGAPHAPGAFVTIEHNLVAFNQVAVELSTTTAATFSKNTFVGNLEQVTTKGQGLDHHNAWSLDGVGNYWDDYQGYDANANGVGDIPFRYERAYDDLIQRNDALRAYAFTPARAALELAARWFPSFSPDAQVVDASPLMSPSMALAPPVYGGLRLAGLLTTVALVVLPLVLFAAARRSGGRRWLPS